MKKYVIVGVGNRGVGMYGVPLSRDFNDVAQIVGVYDPNHKRSEVLVRKVAGKFPVYRSFDEMINETKPDAVIVATVDRYHHEYIIKALEAGCDAISEKPMTIDEDKCNAILETEKRTGKKVIVTLNCRFAPFSARLKEILNEGSIGKILSVHFEWLLDTSHGADYFRRWHRRIENSGGLLIHKASHHFDLANWLIGEEPVTVNGFGTRRFYGPTREQRGIRCLTCCYKDSCEFYFDIYKGKYKELYLDCEDVDGYFRDGCVFSDEVNIYESMSVNVLYSGGTIMSYSLTAHSPYEGYRIMINGTNGRLEAENLNGGIGAFAGECINKIKIYNRRGEEISIKVPVVGTEHGGGDERLLNMIFRGGIPDPLGQMANSRAGAMSILIGVAANKSIREGKSINIKDLLKY